ncbi:hypothetical protein RZS28_14210 [Methylocapsa polymorpha]|uniref:Uncharacterized protein n=1 Tax=Methylocapsa polymorpha TaxID=3080828 RepID=A0ABZ0HYU7_9HYPH|nr:hypothetical protein RZS28_14210 [Methylocapsa sp. RX1]
MPRFEQASTGILFTPLPERATARTDSGIGALCKSKDRKRIASGWEHSDAIEYLSRGSQLKPSAGILS